MVYHIPVAAMELPAFVGTGVLAKSVVIHVEEGPRSQDTEMVSEGASLGGAVIVNHDEAGPRSKELMMKSEGAGVGNITTYPLEGGPKNQDTESVSEGTTMGKAVGEMQTGRSVGTNALPALLYLLSHPVSPLVPLLCLVIVSEVSYQRG